MTTHKTPRDQLVDSLRNSKEARDAFVWSHIEDGIPFQIRANRVSRDLSQKKLGEICGMKQTAVSRLESGEAGLPNLSTLLRLASAFDVAVVVRFVPFSELIDWSMKIPQRGIASIPFHQDKRLERSTSEATHNVINMFADTTERDAQSFPSSVSNDDLQEARKTSA